MPTYEYICKSCGHAFEEIQKISEPPLDTCPKCGQQSAQRLISQGNFILKGGGWYTTGGYGEPAKPKDNSTSESKSVKSDKAAATPTPEAAPAATTETKAEPAASTSTAPAAPAKSESSTTTTATP